MSNASNPSFPDFGRLVPGFDFLQNLTKQAAGVSQAVPQLPNLANWIAPTLNVEELDKRVQELKAVQFWLDQNAAALKATIQALEVQKMTLATLKGMNFNMGDLANAFKLKVGDSVAGGVQQVADKAKSFAGLDIPPSTYAAEKAEAAAVQDAGDAAKASIDTSSRAKGSTAKPAKPAEPAAPAPAGLADPMQWWGALTQQFQAIAANAMQEAAKNTAMDMTKTMAKDAVKTATSIGSGLAKNMAATTSKTIADGARAAMGTALGSVWPKPGLAKSAATAAPAPGGSRKAAASRKAVDKPQTKPATRKIVARKSAATKPAVRKASVTKTRR